MDCCSPKIILYFKQEWQLLRGFVWICWRTSNKKHSLKCLNVWPYKSASLYHPHQPFNAFTYGLIVNYGLTKFADLVRDFHF